ncbi:hypothetical protein CPLU01_12912 [Colletotrichum plurivorum]|uniref:Uncharacterized protein n=1 Tax=Colletotrichum plurivorum TaxID=2175906 RepID=A0A8H6JW69_9PEZI|nr:hypothetical protein CPLU01_12912 [Colletotrichum plurivorum]
MPSEKAPVAALSGKQAANPSSKKGRHKKAADQAKSAGTTDTTQVVPDTTQPGPTSAPIALDLPDSLAIDDDSEEYKDVDNDFEELVFHVTKWFCRNAINRIGTRPNAD